MNSKKGLMTVLVGLAMLATPIAAAAKDHNHFDSNGARESKHEFRNGRGTWMPPPAAVARHDWHEDKHEWKHGWNGGDADDYRGYGNGGYYGNRGYYGVPAYPVAAPYYGGGYGGGGRGCDGAVRIMRDYQRDRATGHPAAAASLIRQNQWALHSGCGNGTPFGRGLFGLGGQGGYGGYGGVPAYNNYGGYGGGYGQPGYGGGYGQPGYGGGSMLAPLMQYFR